MSKPCCLLSLCKEETGQKKTKPGNNLEKQQGNGGVKKENTETPKICDQYKKGLFQNHIAPELSCGSISSPKSRQSQTLNKMNKAISFLTQKVEDLSERFNKANSETEITSFENVNVNQFPVNANLSESFSMIIQETFSPTNLLQGVQENTKKASVIYAITEITETLAQMKKDINQIKRQQQNSNAIFSEDDECIHQIGKDLNMHTQDKEEEQVEEKDNSKNYYRKSSRQTNSDQGTDKSDTKSQVKALFIDVNEGDTEQCIKDITNMSSISQRSSVSISSQIPITALIETAYNILKKRDKVLKITHLNQEIDITAWLCVNKEILEIQFKLNGLNYKFFSYIKNRIIGDPYMDDLYSYLEEYQNQYENNEKQVTMAKKIQDTEDHLCYIAVVTSHRKQGNS